MTTGEALRELGVGPESLSDAERARLDREGYLLFPALLTAAEAAAMRERFDALAAEEGERAGVETHQEAGSVRLSDLVNKEPLFDPCFTHPRVLAAVAHVLEGDLRLSSLNGRAALPGAGRQALHADWDGDTAPAGFHVCNSIWLLDDFTARNGPTRFVPGSHRRGLLPQQALADPAASHPDEILLIAPAGSVAVWNGHLWHGGTRNETSRPRRALHAYFCRRGHPQQTDQSRFLRPRTRARLSPAALHLLDV